MHEDDPAAERVDTAGETALPPAAPADSAGLRAGERVGPYKILQPIGEGGFAVVFLAEQEKPVQRRVALKVIKLGMDTRQVLGRFEAERQALAMMDHPNVARVFDAGSTETGRPYFVMEYVPGVPVTEHCDRQRLGLKERLNLFVQVCEAVQHAHQKGIIHRDIKPSNVLVSVKDGAAQVKVIDFGVAKAIAQRLTEVTLYTELGQLIGTPEYMSPEQAEMTAQDIDTRSDIYSLGVLLYELLTGALPFDPTSLRRAALCEIQRIIREEEPPRPSTRLSSLGEQSTDSARSRRLDTRTLLRALRGDLDWITMKALEKDRIRRYPTASDLARDVARHINGEAVDAAPPSSLYRLGRFVTRHRRGINIAVAVGIGWLSLSWLLIGLEDYVPGLSVIPGWLLFLYAIPVAVVALSFLVYIVARGRAAAANAVVATLLLSVYLAWNVQFWRSAEAPEERQERALLRAYESITRGTRGDHERAATLVEALVELYDAWGKPEQAAEWRAKLPKPQESLATP